MYHDIIKKRGRKSVYFDCTVDEFRAQLDFLAEQGAQPITLEQLHRHLVRGETLPEKAIVLTFDDNYQGFFENAYPLLKERGYPGAMFVHTNFVGDKKGDHPKMSWDTLRELDKDGLVTIASHTESHQEDMAKLPVDRQDTELTQSKAILERELGHPIPYFAYPSGTGDAVTWDAAKRAGYTMAFTIENGPVEESPGILRLNRYIHTRLKDAWQQAQDAALNAPASVVQTALAPAPVTLTVATFAGVKLGLVKGGTLTTTLAQTGVRQSVGEFIQQTPGAVAGINGTFFANAELRGTDNALIGPSQTATGAFIPESADYRLPKLRNRPLVIWGPTQIALVPFEQEAANDEESLRRFMPDFTDAFLSGGWIVHNGLARTEAEMKPYAVADFNDPRRRAFFGLTAAGEPVLGGSLVVITTEKLAEAAAAAGVQEAVLLDSGFSTSVVFDGKIIVTGHTAKNLPSRPVPHAIMLIGTVTPPADPNTLKTFTDADPAVGEISAAQAQAEAPGPRRRRRAR